MVTRRPVPRAVAGDGCISAESADVPQAVWLPSFPEAQR